MVAYLNGGIEGSIYWGITDDRQAIGVSLDPRERDEFRKDIVAELRAITPAIIPTSYDIIFHPLFAGNKAETPMPDQCIIEVKVERVSPRQVHFIPGTKGEQAFIKTNAGIEEAKGKRLVELQKKIQTGQANQEEQEGTPPAPEPLPVKEPKSPIPASFNNPYDIDVIATEDMFKGREHEIERLRFAIRNGTHTAIFGLQRMGKTSLVTETLRHVTENCLFVEVDLQTHGGPDLTYRALLNAITTGIAAQVSSRRVQVVRDEIDLYMNYGLMDKHSMLQDFIETLKTILVHTRRKVVLFLDEFSALCETIDRNESQFRDNLNQRTSRMDPRDMLVDVSVMQCFSALMRDRELKGKVVFIYALRPFVAEYDANMQLQILKLVTPITLHHLSRSAAEALMVEPVKDTVEYEAGSIDYLYSLTAGHPYLIQFFLHEIIGRLEQDGRSCIEKQDITRLEGELVSAEEVYEGQFAVLESDYSVESVRSPEAARKGRGVIAVIARLGEQEKEGWVPVEEVRNRLTSHGMPENEIYDILAKLRRAQIIKERRVGEEKLEYRISIPLLRKIYIRQNMYQRHFQR